MAACTESSAFRLIHTGTYIQYDVVTQGSSEAEYNEHVDGHFEHRCRHCSYSSRSEAHLRRHVGDVHSTSLRDDVSQTNDTSVATLEHHHHHHQQQQQQRLIKCKQCSFSTRVRVSDAVGFCWATNLIFRSGLGTRVQCPSVTVITWSETLLTKECNVASNGRLDKHAKENFYPGYAVLWQMCHRLVQ